MEHVKLGSTGLDVSRICLGCMTYGIPDRGPHPWSLDEEESRPIIRGALELGINFFDTANVYSDGTSEEIVGRALKDFASRDDVVIATKVRGAHAPGPERRRACRGVRIMAEIDHSLRRLGMDYVDLYQIHRTDPDTPIEETMEALHDVVKAGKARYIGASQHGRVAVHQGALRCRAALLDAVRDHAGPPQPALPRGGAGDAAAVPRRGDRRDPLEPARPRPPDPQLGREQRAAGDRRSSAARSTRRRPRPTGA